MSNVWGNFNAYSLNLYARSYFVFPHLSSTSASPDTPAQRVQFLLGTEDGDEEHIPHALFTEMDEICLREGEDAEWKETARYIFAWSSVALLFCCSQEFYPISIHLKFEKKSFFKASNVPVLFDFCLQTYICLSLGGLSLRRMLKMVASGGVNLTWPPCPCTVSLSYVAALWMALWCWTWGPTHWRRLPVNTAECVFGITFIPQITEGHRGIVYDRPTQGGVQL